MIAESSELRSEDSAQSSRTGRTGCFPAKRFWRWLQGVRGRSEASRGLPSRASTTDVLERCGDHGLRTDMGLPRYEDHRRGLCGLRKGIDRFVSAGLSPLRRAGDGVAFIWAGALSGEVAANWFQPEIDASGLGERVRILGHRDDVDRFYASANALYLSSRGGSLPVCRARGARLRHSGRRPRRLWRQRRSHPPVWQAPSAQ